MQAESRALLWDARNAAERVMRFTSGRTFQEYEADEMLQSVVERQLVMIGRATASREPV